MGAAAIWAMVLVAAGPGKAFGPFRTAAAPVTREARDEVAPARRLPTSDPLWFAFLVYQRTLSAQDGPRCAHVPTCSLYGVQAVRRHPVLGFGLTVERLWRANRSSYLRPLPADFRLGRHRLFDPLDANDFWLRGIDDATQGELLPPTVRQ